MSSFKLSYLAWPAMIGLCGAWAFSGFMFTGAGASTGFSDPVQAVAPQPTKPDFDSIDQKNIFKADLSAVARLDDAQVSMPQDAAADQTQQVVLLGIVRGRYTAYAIVSSNGENLVLKLGIPKQGLVLKKVHHDSVDVLTEAGNLMTLKFVITKDDDQSQTPAQHPAQQPDQQNTQQADTKTDQQNGATQPSGQQPADQPATQDQQTDQQSGQSSPPVQTGQPGQSGQTGKHMLHGGQPQVNGQNG